MENNLCFQGNGITGFLNPGEYFFPFSFPLPSTIPSSFEHEFGHVRFYKIPFFSVLLDTRQVLNKLHDWSKGLLPLTEGFSNIIG